MSQSGRGDVAPATVPEAVAAVIERRLARLPEAALATLQAGAIAGNPFSVETVARIGGLTIADAADGLDTAVGVGFVDRVDLRGDFSFSHDLVRDVVLGGISSARRAACTCGSPRCTRNGSRSMRRGTRSSLTI